MKRQGYLYEQIASMDNLREAHRRAKRGKSHYKEVIEIEKDPEYHLSYLKDILDLGLFTTSKYRVFLRREGGKLRKIHALPYFPDRIVHHTIMLVMGDTWQKSLIRDTFQSLPGRGTSDARKRVSRAIRNDKPTYYLQVDVRKFYPSVPHWALKQIVRKSIKCERTLTLLFDIIESVPGLPIGNYISQILGNLVLSPVDWYAKQDLRLKHYFRYCDDIVVLHDDKRYLAEVKDSIERRINALGLELKPNWLIQAVDDNGLDFCGYVFWHDDIKLRQSIVDRFEAAVEQASVPSIISYWGWIKPLNNLGLWQKAKEVLRHENIRNALTC